MPWWSPLVREVFLDEHWRPFIRAVILIVLLLAVLYVFGTVASAITGAGATAVAVTRTIMSRRGRPATDK
jgi:small-conductance mechanosensitive channel